MRRFARLVARGETDALIGKNFDGLFKPDIIYQAEEILGVITIKEIGISSAKTRNSYGGTMPDLDCRSCEDLMTMGDYLLTPDEITERTRRMRERENNG